MTEQLNSQNPADALPQARRWLLRLMLLLCCLQTGVSVAADTRIHDARTLLVDGVYRVGARIDFNLNETLRDALRNGVPLVIALRIEVIRGREWLWSELVAALRQRYSLEYHALTQRYVVRNFSTNETSSFRDLSSALNFIGNVYDLPLIDANLLKPNLDYQVRMRADLDIEALPTPVRLGAYLGSDWNLQGDWHKWPLRQ